MHYTNEIVINAPRDRVVTLFDDGSNVKQWQPTLIDMEPISGKPGTPGAQTRLYFKEKGRSMEMVETILAKNLPDSMTLLFELGGSSGVWNKNHNLFEERDDNTTLWKMENEFKFKGLMQIVGWFIRSNFPKETQKSMELFKAFVEETLAVEAQRKQQAKPQDEEPQLA